MELRDSPLIAGRILRVRPINPLLNIVDRTKGSTFRTYIGTGPTGPTSIAVLKMVSEPWKDRIGGPTGTVHRIRNSERGSQWT